MEKRILIVDDEPDLAESVSRYAQKCGYDTLFTTRSKEFKRLYYDFEPTVIVLDIIMADIDGIEIVHWLNKISSPASIIFITGFDPQYAVSAELLASANAKGCKTAILTKPILLSTFRDALTRMEPAVETDQFHRTEPSAF